MILVGADRIHVPQAKVECPIDPPIALPAMHLPNPEHSARNRMQSGDQSFNTRCCEKFEGMRRLLGNL
jgi:hypothetical protein